MHTGSIHGYCDGDPLAKKFAAYDSGFHSRSYSIKKALKNQKIKIKLKKGWKFNYGEPFPIYIGKMDDMYESNTDWLMNGWITDIPLNSYISVSLITPEGLPVEYMLECNKKADLQHLVG